MRIMRSLINICKSCIRAYVSTSPGRHLHQTHTRACSRLQHTAVPGITTQQPGLGRYCRYCTVDIVDIIDNVDIIDPIDCIYLEDLGGGCRTALCTRNF